MKRNKELAARKKKEREEARRKEQEEDELMRDLEVNSVYFLFIFSLRQFLFFYNFNFRKKTDQTRIKMFFAVYRQMKKLIKIIIKKLLDLLLFLLRLLNQSQDEQTLIFVKKLLMKLRGRRRLPQSGPKAPNYTVVRCMRIRGKRKKKRMNIF